MSTTATMNIILIEDNKGDILLFKEALAGQQADVRVFEDGKEAYEYLLSVDKHDVLPNMIVLDLNLPGMRGHDVLKKLKQHAFLKKVPVVILSSSSDKDDIEKAYANHASCYIIKPSEFSGLLDAINRMQAFWFKTVALPFKEVVTP